jgi:hypothetical protein
VNLKRDNQSLRGVPSRSSFFFFLFSRSVRKVIYLLCRLLYIGDRFGVGSDLELMGIVHSGRF